MVHLRLVLFVTLLFGVSSGAFGEQGGPISSKWSLVIHGGAGVTLKRGENPEREALYADGLKQALAEGQRILEAGGTSLEAVTAAVVILEDNPLFNAGRGAVFTNALENELDASIMDGRTMNSGAVTGLKTIKNPILAALGVMEQSPHVMMQGDGAEHFATSLGLETVDQSYFHTEKRWNQIQTIKNERGDIVPVDHNRFGTVGAVALDKFGNIAAATSTGGMTNKKWGRVGDSPIIGAGTYASNASCAVSATGHGEYFIRRTVARDICALVEYKGYALEHAARAVIHGSLEELGGDGGIIAVDRHGNMVMDFNTRGMYRGVVANNQPAEVVIFRDE